MSHKTENIALGSIRIVHTRGGGLDVGDFTYIQGGAKKTDY